MAYQNVGTPRFYVNVIEWLASTGIISLSGVQNVFRTLPVDPSANFSNPQLPEDGINYATVPPESIPLLTSDMDKFVFVLGHNMKTMNNEIVLEGATYSDETINANLVEFNGFSLIKYIGDLEKILLNWSNIGSIVIANAYTMPHSPDLNITMSREMNGVQRLRTRGGSDLVNYKYKRSPNWGDAAPWELYLIEYGLTSQKLARYGKRTWDLSWSYLAAKDVMGAPEFVNQIPYTESIAGAGNSGGTELTGLGWDSDDIDDSDSFEYNLLDHDDFYSQVIHKTGGGRLPFIFQPNTDDPTVLAICKFDQNFSFQQISPSLYSVSLRIKEVW